jgi:radical SAM superfamily enzyme YgiQ (UPF0313 family)
MGGTENRAWRYRSLNSLGLPSTFMPKLSAMILAGLTPDTYEFVYVDQDIEEIDYDIAADLIAITCMTAQSSQAYRIAGEFRKRGLPVVFGGIHVAVRPEEVARHCDTLVVGEAEHSWPALLEDFERGEMKAVYRSTDFPPVTQLTAPRTDIIQHDRYVNFPLQATRGCPYDCDFCSIKHSSGHHYRMKPVEAVVADIQAYERFNADGPGRILKRPYFFIDDNLYVNRGYVIELLRALIPLGITWHAQGTVNMANDDEVLQLMAASGCRSFQFGFESISPEALKEANKPRVNKVDNYVKIINKVQSYGIIVGGYFIFGFDSDTDEVFERTVDFVKSANLSQAMLNTLTPYPGTRLYDRMADRIVDHHWANYNAWGSVFTPAQMTADDLQAGLYWAGLEVVSSDHLKTSLSYFWEQGPWPHIQTLTRFERLALVYMGLNLAANGMARSAGFLFWAARQKKACDFRMIVWQVMRTDLIEPTRPRAYNPAERRRLKAARGRRPVTV